MIILLKGLVRLEIRFALDHREGDKVWFSWCKTFSFFFFPSPFFWSVVLFHADNRMERCWHFQSCRCYQPFSWTFYVGDITSWCEKVEFRIVFLHPSTICGVCPLLCIPCWWFYFQHGCWCNISFHAWSVFKILPITKDCWCSFSQMPSMWNCRTGLLKTRK